MLQGKGLARCGSWHTRKRNECRYRCEYFSCVYTDTNLHMLLFALSLSSCSTHVCIVGCAPRPELFTQASRGLTPPVAYTRSLPRTIMTRRPPSCNVLLLLSPSRFMLSQCYLTAASSPKTRDAHVEQTSLCSLGDKTSPHPLAFH